MQKINVNQLWRTFFLESKSFLQKIAVKIRGNSDAIKYYAILIAVLGTLGTAAYRYRVGDQTPIETAQPISSEESVVATVKMPDLSTIFPEVQEVTAVVPVAGGNVISGYCDDHLIWNEDLQQWQTHRGTDYSGGAGEAVVAVLDGVVTDVYQDSLYGNTVIIDHGENQIARYASLSTLEMAEVGRKVSQGEIIGSVGECAAEASLGRHVHLEYLVEGDFEDFEAITAEEDEKDDESLQD